MHPHIRYWVSFVLCTVLASGAASAQQRLSISGTVDDTFGVVAGAMVILQIPGGAARQTATDAVGQYLFSDLEAGSYQISVVREGFTTATRTVSLTTSSRTVDLTLAVAGFVSSIEVLDVGGKTTATRMGVPDREVPSQVSVVSQATLREQGINDLATALENISGVITQVQYGVYEWYTISGITQQSGNDFLYVDGMAMTGNRSNTQINNVEQIQVFKGPSAVLYGGAGASQGGMVNIIRKKPQAARFGELQYKVGRWGLQQTGGGAAGEIGSPSVLYRVDASFSRSDGWRDAGSTKFNVTPTITWVLSPRARISFNESLTRDRYDLDAGVPTTLLDRPGFPLDRRLNPPTDFQLTRDWQNQIVFNATLTDRLQLRNVFFSRRNRDQYLDAETLNYSPSTDVLTRSELYFQHNRRPLQNAFDLLGDYALGRMRHRFMVGVDAARHYTYTNRIGDVPGASNNATVPIPSIVIADFLRPDFVDPAPTYTSFPRTRVDHSLNRVVAGYWQDQIDLTTRLRVNVAGRYDDYRRRAHNDTYDNDQFVSAGAVTTRHQSNYSYRAGAVYALSGGQSAYAGVATTFQPVFTIPADGKELEPTRSRSVEVGHRFELLNGRLSGTTALRRIVNYNLLIPLGGSMYDQAGRSHSTALDVDVEGGVGRGYRLVASVGYANPRYDDYKASATGANLAGNRLAHAPTQTARLWVTKSVQIRDRSAATVSLGGRYVSEYFTNATNTVTLPSRLTFDGAIGFRRPTWDVTAHLVNLSNKQRYFVSQINGGTQLYPGQPFSASVALSYRFD